MGVGVSVDDAATDAGEGAPPPVLSVVIPTRGRPGVLARAVRSALEQTFTDLEVLVVVDGEDPETVAALESVDDERLSWHVRAVSGGPSAARNQGVHEARGRWIAFLDDDDQWYPDKIERQLDHAQQAARPEDLVLATAAHWRTDEATFTWPTRDLRPHERVADYLFVRTWPGEGVLATPTLMLSRDLAIRCPLPEDLHRHEDYDWFLRLEQAGAAFEVILVPLVCVDARIDRTSLSRGGEWRQSLDWARSRRAELGPRAFSGFVLTDVARAVARDRKPLTAGVVLASALTGRPRVRDLCRFLLVQVVPERLRWRIEILVRRFRP